MVLLFFFFVYYLNLSTNINGTNLEVSTNLKMVFISVKTCTEINVVVLADVLWVLL